MTLTLTPKHKCKGFKDIPYQCKYCLKIQESKKRVKDINAEVKELTRNIKDRLDKLSKLV